MIDDDSLRDTYRRTGLTGVYEDIFPSEDPEPVSPPPQPGDARRGWMRRYFLQRKRPRGRRPFEVDVRQWRSFQNAEQGIPQRLYRGAVVKWRITGPEETQVNTKGYPVRVGVRPANTRLTALYEDELPRLSETLDDPLEYHRHGRSTGNDGGGDR